MIRTPQVPTLSDPKLIDYVLIEIQQALVGLSWAGSRIRESNPRRPSRTGGR
ncbi:MAG: hypothetical protein IPJ00_21045 [Saprospirales bacterium]|nr:hypothetical protein [Saprospirales bacterium]